MFVSEPVRLYLYPVLIAVIGALVGYGIIEQDQASLWLALGAAVLGIAGTEAARAKVTPVAKLGQE